MVATTLIKNLHDMTRATFIQRPVSNMDHTNQNKPVLANQLFLNATKRRECIYRDDDDHHGNFRFHSHHELPRPNLIWLKHTYLF